MKTRHKRALPSYGPPFMPWFRVGMNAWSLGMEMSSVIALRMLRVASGGAAGATEARRSVSEKIESGITLPGKVLAARTAHGAATKAINHYRPKVRANLKRLGKAK